MIDFIRLKSAQDSLFDLAFALYETSFPIHEQRPLHKQKVLLANPRYHFDVIREDGAFAGILLYWEFPGYIYIEHFAIDSSKRGNAIGSRSLAAFCENRPLVILEIDPPVDAVSIRREGFYQRLGFASNSYPHTHPAYRAGFSPHALVVMSYPRRLAENEYTVFHEDLKNIVMRDMD